MSLSKLGTQPGLRILVAGFTLVCGLGACQPQSRAATADVPAPPVAIPASVPAPASVPTPASVPAPASEPAPAPGTVVMSVGEELTIAPDTRLRLLRVVSDSRCPKDVQCIWAGEVTLEFQLSEGSGSKKFQLSQMHSPGITIGATAFELKSYQACPPNTGRLSDAECATVAITAAPDR